MSHDVEVVLIGVVVGTVLGGISGFFFSLVLEWIKNHFRKKGKRRALLENFADLYKIAHNVVSYLSFLHSHHKDRLSKALTEKLKEARWAFNSELLRNAKNNSDIIYVTSSSFISAITQTITIEDLIPYTSDGRGGFVFSPAPAEACDVGRNVLLACERLYIYAYREWRKSIPWGKRNALAPRPKEFPFDILLARWWQISKRFKRFRLLRPHKPAPSSKKK